MHRRRLVPALSLILAMLLFCALAPALASGATIAQKKAQAVHIAGGGLGPEHQDGVRRRSLRRGHAEARHGPAQIDTNQRS